MIFHAADDDRFVSLVGDDPAHIFKDLLAPGLMEKVLSSLHSKNDLNVDLGICTCHDDSPMMFRCRLQSYHLNGAIGFTIPLGILS
jgi:hypothetical protein